MSATMVRVLQPRVDQPTTVRGSLISRHDLVLAGGLGLLAMVVALVFRSALVPTDPWHYVQGALAFPDGSWRPEGLARWGYLLPIIPFARLWGDATATYYVIPLLSTGLLAGVLFLLGTRYVGRVAGVLGAALALGTPLVFVNLTRGYTDLTATTLVGLALLLATLAEDAAREAQRSDAGWGRRVPALLVATGFVTAWSFEVRETAVFAWPVVAWILWRVGPWREVAKWVVPAGLSWLLLDLALCAWVYDDPFLKLRHLAGADISSSEVTSDAVYVGHSRWWYATILLRSIWAVSGGPALLAALLVGLVGGIVYRRELGRLWTWGVLALGLLWAQGGPLSPAHPSVRLDVARYWLAFLVPLLLVAACTLVLWVRQSQGRWRLAAVGASTLLVLGVLVPGARFATSYPGFAPNGGDALSELRTYLADSDEVADSRIWSDWGTQRVLPTYQSGPFGGERWSASTFRSLNRLLRVTPNEPDDVPLPGDYVVLHSADDRTCFHCRRALRDVAEVFGPFPRSGWTELFTSSAGNLTLYRLEPWAVWPAPPAGWEPGDEVEGSSEPSGESITEASAE